MVKLERAEKPDVWTDQNVKRWTKNWQQKIDRANASSKKAVWVKWPQANKERINHTATANMIEWHSYKCAFCEVQDASNLEIEHFYPKSKYSAQAFEWVNLFLICKRCNLIKGEDEPEISLKPDVDEPSEYLWYSPALQRIVPKPGISTKAKGRAAKTIKLYGLDRMDLQYQLFWHKITLQSNPINLAQLSINSSNIDWNSVRNYIQENYPEIEARANPTEEFSLMVRSVIKNYIPAESKPDTNPRP